MRAKLSLNDENIIISINWSDFSPPTVEMLIEDFVKQYNTGLDLSLTSPKLYLNNEIEVIDIDSLHKLNTGEVRLYVKTGTFSPFIQPPINHSISTTPLSAPSLLSSPYPVSLTPTPNTPNQPNSSSLMFYNNIPTYELWKISPDEYEYKKPNINVFDKTLITSIEELQALQASTMLLSEANSNGLSDQYYYQGNLPTLSTSSSTSQQPLTNVEGITPNTMLDGYYYDGVNNTPNLIDSSNIPVADTEPISYSNNYILFPTEPIQQPSQSQPSQDTIIPTVNNTTTTTTTTITTTTTTTASTSSNTDGLISGTNQIANTTPTSANTTSSVPSAQSKMIPIAPLDFPLYYNDEMIGNQGDTYIDSNSNTNSGNGSIQLMNYSNGYDSLDLSQQQQTPLPLPPNEMMLDEETLYYLQMQQPYDQYGQLIPPEQLLLQQQQLQQQMQMQQQQLEGKTKSSKRRNKKNKVKNIPVGHNPITPPPSSPPITQQQQQSKHNNKSETIPVIPGAIIIEPKPDAPPPKPPLPPVSKDNSLAGMLKPAKNKKKKNKKNKGNNSIENSTTTSHRSSFSSTTDILKDEIVVDNNNCKDEEKGKEKKTDEKKTNNVNNKTEDKSNDKDKTTEPAVTPNPINNNKSKKDKNSNNKKDNNNSHISPPQPPSQQQSSNTTTSTSKSKKKSKKQKNNNNNYYESRIDIEELPSINIRPEHPLINAIPTSTNTSSSSSKLQVLQPPNKFQLKVQKMINDPNNQVIYPRLYDCIWCSLSSVNLAKTKRILLDCIRRKSPFNSKCYFELAKHYYSIKYYEMSEKYIRSAIILSPNNYNYWLLYGLILKSESEIDDNRLNDAVYALRQALIWYNFCYSYKHHADSNELLQMLGNYAYCLFRTGFAKQTVNSIIKYILSFSKNEYSSIYLQCYIAYEDGSNFDKLITLFPRSYKLFPKDVSLKSLFAKILDVCVKKDSITSDSIHSADDLLLFQSLCLENGYVESAVYLCELAIKKDNKKTVSYFKLMNLYIIQARYDDAVHTCRRWLFANLYKCFNSLQLKDILNVIGQNSLPIDNLLSIQYESKPTELDAKKQEKVNELWKNLKPCQLIWNPENEPYATILTSDGKFFDTPSSSSSGKAFSQNEMEMLGILFVLVKALYLAGSLRLIPPLIKMIEPLRYKRKIEDMEYVIESDYYKYIAQLLCETGSDLPRYMMSSTPSPSPQYPEIIIIGDSHVLSAGWRIIKIHGIDVLLRMKYIDGLKAEYLFENNNSKENKKSYQHYNYKLLLNTIKEKSIVIFAFCEFDSIYTLIEKTTSDMYNDVVETAKDTIKKCINEIKRIKNEKLIFPIVQPVLPISNHRRSLTKLYNEILKRECERENIAHYIGLSDNILNSNSTLRSQYELDKVHIHPVYLYDVVKALENLIPMNLLQIPQI